MTLNRQCGRPNGRIFHSWSMAMAKRKDRQEMEWISVFRDEGGDIAGTKTHLGLVGKITWLDLSLTVTCCWIGL